MLPSRPAIFSDPAKLTPVILRADAFRQLGAGVTATLDALGQHDLFFGGQKGDVPDRIEVQIAPNHLSFPCIAVG